MSERKSAFRQVSFKRTGQHKMSIAERTQSGTRAVIGNVVAANDCPLCLNESRLWFISRDRHVRRCQHCGFIWVPQGLSRNPDGQSIYEADKPIFFDDGNENYYLDDASFTNARIKLKLVRQTVPSGAKLIDVGAGFGHFIKLAQEHYAATGLEISSVAVKWGRQQLGANLITGPLDAPLPGLHQKFDVVTMWDVIEHLENPLSALHSIKSRLKAGGYLILSTPDTGSLVAGILGERWYYLDPIQHIALFNRSNLSRLLNEAGFDIVRIGSMGHSYKIEYALTRLAYLYRSGVMGSLVHLLSFGLNPFKQHHVFINPHDVLTLVARTRT
jgi:2-polyprenyl-3-methyl-5-hydroxy-6-metoxy-1,4-benzoquinol methylase